MADKKPAKRTAAKKTVECRWGEGDDWVDVTLPVGEEITATNAAFGDRDPAPGRVKTLIVGDDNQHIPEGDTAVIE